MKPYIIFFLIQLPCMIYAQLNLSGSYVSSFGKSVNNFNFFENRININSDWNDWTSWLELEHSNPPELGKKIIGIRKFRFEYQANKYGVKIGDLYEFWGNGLIFNMLDDQSIDMDTGIRGGLFSYNFGFLSAEYLIGAHQSFRSTTKAPDFDERIPNYKTDYKLQAGKISFDISRNRFEFFALNVKDQHLIPTKNQYLRLKDRLFGLSFSHIFENFEADYHYVQKSHNDGKAFNLNTFLFLEDYAISISFKDYRFNELSPFDRFDFVNHPHGVYYFQQMPTVYKIHSSLYLGRVAHQIDYNDEVGFNIGIEKSHAQNGTILLNYAQSSRHNEWALNSSSGFNSVWSIRKKSILSSSDWRFNPFSEVYLEVNGYYDSRLFYQISLAKTRDITDIFTNIYSPQGHSFSYNMLESITFPVLISYQLTPQNSFNFQFEYQKIKKGMIIKNPEANLGKEVFGSAFAEDIQGNTFLSIGYSRSPYWSISIDIDNASTEDILVVENGRNNNFVENFLNPFFDKSMTWASINYSMNLFSSTLISLSYGSQRAGIFCSNGVCRNMQAFEKGIKLGVTTAF